jgi:hypothetical protein
MGSKVLVCKGGTPQEGVQARMEFFFFGLEPMQVDSAIEMNAAII